MNDVRWKDSQNSHTSRPAATTWVMGASLRKQDNVIANNMNAVPSQTLFKIQDLDGLYRSI